VEAIEEMCGVCVHERFSGSPGGTGASAVRARLRYDMEKFAVAPAPRRVRGRKRATRAGRLACDRRKNAFEISSGADNKQAYNNPLILAATRLERRRTLKSRPTQSEDRKPQIDTLKISHFAEEFARSATLVAQLRSGRSTFHFGRLAANPT
jgi:hypothetical protein